MPHLFTPAFCALDTSIGTAARILFGLRVLLLTAAILTAPSSGHADGVADSPMEICPAPLGTVIPDVSVREMDGTEVSLIEALAGQPTVLLIYRGGWCPYCSVHLSDMATIEFELHNLGYQILAISPDAPPQLLVTDAKAKPGYALLSDSEMNLAQALGIAFRLDEETLSMYRDYGIDLEQASGRDHHLLPVPAAIIVDVEGIIRFFYVNPDYKSRVDVKVLLAAAKAYKKAK